MSASFNKNAGSDLCRTVMDVAERSDCNGAAPMGVATWCAFFRVQQKLQAKKLQDFRV